ncbi:hypothetical protein [Methanimicrococcus hacksteinii]|nr:hypothetical protein [Methanimicrococcus sp. At1]
MSHEGAAALPSAREPHRFKRSDSNSGPFLIDSTHFYSDFTERFETEYI